MPTVELSLSETTYTNLRQTAERRSQLLGDVVEEALQAFLQPPPIPRIEAGNGSAASADDWRRAKIHVEAEAWRAIPSEVRRSYGDDFVAVHDGQVIDHHYDRLTLYRRVRAVLGDAPVLITPANAVSPREFQLRSPRLERQQ